MINHLKGKLIEKTPTYAVIECNGVGYMIHISLNTYAKLPDEEACKLYTHLSIKEDAHTLYGFINEGEREVFRNLISVNGVGANTARMMLSSLSPAEIQEAIASGDVTALKGIKGIGEKSAQRIIVDLKGKMGKLSGISDLSSIGGANSLNEEALAALTRLGFNKSVAEKALSKALRSHPTVDNVEELLKQALKQL